MATKMEPKLGSVLKNGFTVIEVTRDIVLALSGSRAEYGVWRLDDDGNTYSGFYAFTLAPAFDNYCARSGK